MTLGCSRRDRILVRGSWYEMMNPDLQFYFLGGEDVRIDGDSGEVNSTANLRHKTSK